MSFARQFSGLVPCLFGVLSKGVGQEHKDLNPDRRGWNPQCCRLHHAPKNFRCRREDSNLRSHVRDKLIYSQPLSPLSHVCAIC
jgi:hypothetical protein